MNGEQVASFIRQSIPTPNPASSPVHRDRRTVACALQIPNRSMPPSLSVWIGSLSAGSSCRVVQARQSNDLSDIEGLDALFARHRGMPTPLVVLLQGLLDCNFLCNPRKLCPKS
jgi:hypothetical protein